jgi:hypothetical protein
MEKPTFQQRLINVQSRLKAPKGQYNSFGKYSYRNQEDILEAVKPLLAENGLTMTISDDIIGVGELMIVRAVVMLTDGVQSMEVSACAGIDTNRKGMDIAQSFGASSSYARKYALNGTFLIDDTKDADATNTHGREAAVATPAAKPVAKPKVNDDFKFKRAMESMKEKGTQEQYDKIVAAMGSEFTQSQYVALSTFIKG